MSSVCSFAQTAEELIQKHIAAIGGAENWKKITALKMNGAITAQGMEIPVTHTVVNGKGMRMDLTIMGMANYFILTDKEGWAYFPVQGQTKAEPLTADRVKESQDQLDVQGDFIDYQAKGNKIEYIGKDDVEGTETFKLKLTNKNGKEKLLFLDASNYYLIREIQKMKADGKEMDATMNYSNYQKLPEGIVIAMSVESQEGPITFKTVEVNPKVDETFFKPSN
jgi:hypothetical protein